MADVIKKSIMVAGTSFEASQPYEAGHVLTEVEAKTLNQTRNENLRNNFAKFVKDAEAGAEGALQVSQLAAAFAKYDAGYTFASPGVSKPKLDPVEREARALAKDILKNHLAKDGRNFKSVPADMSTEEWEAKIEENIDLISAKDGVIKTAKENVRKRQGLIDSASSELSL